MSGSSLLEAVSAGDTEAVDAALEKPKVRLNTRHQELLGGTVLHKAASLGKSAVVRRLLDTGKAKVNVTDSLGRTPLHYAAEEGDVDSAKALISARARTDVFDRGGNTPLLLAAAAGHAHVVSFLVTMPYSSVNACTPNGETALFKACQRGYLPVVRALLEEGKAQGDLANADGVTPLHVASEEGHLELVRWLGKSGLVDVNAASHLGNTPLYTAAYKGRLEVVKCLVEDGKATVDLRNHHGHTAFSIASEQSHHAVAAYLRSHDATLDPTGAALPPRALAAKPPGCCAIQ